MWLANLKIKTTLWLNYLKHREYCTCMRLPVKYYLTQGIFSIYPPFYQGAHSAVLAWISFIILLLMHIFCFVNKKIKERSLWSIMYFLFQILLVVWFLLALGFAYNWSSKQWINKNQLHTFYFHSLLVQ